MSETKVNTYDKMSDFIESIFNIFQLINRKSDKSNDKRLKMIALMVYNYAKKMAKDNEVDIKKFTEPDSINLIPIFEYISYKNIELYDFSKIDMSDVDTSKNEDLERFVLTHIYYITQPTK
jgi:hypothetical protein